MSGWKKRTLRTLSRLIRLAVRLAMQPEANRSRALAMSTRGVRTGTPTASTAIDLGVVHREHDVEVVDHHVEDDVDVEAALGKPAQPVHLDEAGRRDDGSAAATAGLKRSVWPTASTAPNRSARASIASASASVAAIGFSTRTCTPRSRNAPATSRCASVGTATTTASTRPKSVR